MSAPTDTGAALDRRASSPGGAGGRRWARGWRLFRGNRSGMVGLGVLAIFVLVALLRSAARRPRGLEVTKATGGVLEPPSAEYWLGTDDNGRSVLTLLIWGARISLFVGLWRP